MSDPDFARRTRSANPAYKNCILHAWSPDSLPATWPHVSRATRKFGSPTTSTGASLLEPGIPAAEFPPRDLQDVAPEGSGEILELFGSQFVIPPGRFSERFIHHREADRRIVQRLASEVRAYRDCIFGDLANGSCQVMHSCHASAQNAIALRRGAGRPQKQENRNAPPSAEALLFGLECLSAIRPAFVER